jgi:hypothetical protein
MPGISRAASTRSRAELVPPRPHDLAKQSLPYLKFDRRDAQDIAVTALQIPEKVAYRENPVAKV